MKYTYVMQKTQYALAIVAMIAVIGVSPAFAAGSSNASFDMITWITGEEVLRLTIDGHCSGNTNRDLEVTFFDDYVYVQIYENGSSWWAVEFTYDKYNNNMSYIIDLVTFC